VSLINQMLSDLEARKGGTLSHVDSALDGLHPAAALRTAVGERPRLVFMMLLLAGALAAAWTTREPLLAYLRAAPPVLPAPPTRAPAVAPSSPATAQAPAAEASPAEAPVPTPIVVLEPPPAEALAPETFDVRLPDSEAAPPLEPDVPAAAAVREVPADLAPVYLEPEPVRAAPPARPASAVRELPPPATRDEDMAGEEPRVDVARLGEPAVEYPGSFRRDRTAAPPVPPAARRLAEVEALFANGNRDLALSKLRGLVLTDPAQETARERLALELIAEGRVTEAEALLRTGLRLAPTSTRLAQPLGHLLLAQSKPDAALAVLRPATPTLAGHEEYHALLAAAEQRTGAHGLAITRYRGLLKEQPLNGSWLVALAISLLAVDERADAAATFARALDDRALPEPLRAYATREMIRLRERS
jgi:Tfp pilus assembly protein PilF